jgi:hypothetical protein
VEQALWSVAEQEDVSITEFTVAPQITPPEGGLAYHEWFVEFGAAPKDLTAFSRKVDEALQKKNIYYHDLITGRVLQPLVIRSLHKNAFVDYMRAAGKLGGQNKVPRLSNDRQIADRLTSFTI